MADDTSSKSDQTGAPSNLMAAPQATIQVDIKDVYQYLKEKPTVEVTSSRYSNYAVTTFGPRDAWIDFLELPGIPVGGKHSVPAFRVYLSHVNAIRLAEAILQTYRQAKANNAIEPLP